MDKETLRRLRVIFEQHHMSIIALGAGKAYFACPDPLSVDSYSPRSVLCYVPNINDESFTEAEGCCMIALGYNVLDFSLNIILIDTFQLKFTFEVYLDFQLRLLNDQFLYFEDHCVVGFLFETPKQCQSFYRRCSVAINQFNEANKAPSDSNLTRHTNQTTGKITKKSSKSKSGTRLLRKSRNSNNKPKIESPVPQFKFTSKPKAKKTTGVGILSPFFKNKTKPKPVSKMIPDDDPIETDLLQEGDEDLVSVSSTVVSKIRWSQEMKDSFRSTNNSKHEVMGIPTLLKEAGLTKDKLKNKKIKRAAIATLVKTEQKLEKRKQQNLRKWENEQKSSIKVTKRATMPPPLPSRQRRDNQRKLPMLSEPNKLNSAGTKYSLARLETKVKDDKVRKQVVKSLQGNMQSFFKFDEDEDDIIW